VAWCLKIFGTAAQKSAIYGEGYARQASPGAQKSAIPEKEIIIFALRKVLFPGKAWWELPGAYSFINNIFKCITTEPKHPVQILFTLRQHTNDSRTFT
jgi:hypothetical protein